MNVANVLTVDAFHHVITLSLANCFPYSGFETEIFRACNMFSLLCYLFLI